MGHFIRKANEIWCFFGWGSPLATMSFRAVLSHTALLLLFSSCLSFRCGDMLHNEVLNFGILEAVEESESKGPLYTQTKSRVHENLRALEILQWCILENRNSVLQL